MEAKKIVENTNIILIAGKYLKLEILCSCTHHCAIASYPTKVDRTNLPPFFSLHLTTIITHF